MILKLAEVVNRLGKADEKLLELDRRVGLSAKLYDVSDVFDGLYLHLSNSRDAICLLNMAMANSDRDVEAAIQLCGDAVVEAYRHRQVREIVNDVVKLHRMREAYEVELAKRELGIKFDRWPLMDKTDLTRLFYEDLEKGLSKRYYSIYDKYVGVFLHGKVFDGIYIHLMWRDRPRGFEEVERRVNLTVDEARALVELARDGDRLKPPGEILDGLKSSGLLHKLRYGVAHWRHMLYDVGVFHLIPELVRQVRNDPVLYLNALLKTRDPKYVAKPKDVFDAIDMALMGKCVELPEEVRQLLRRHGIKCSNPSRLYELQTRAKTGRTTTP